MKTARASGLLSLLLLLPLAPSGRGSDSPPRPDVSPPAAEAALPSFDHLETLDGRVYESARVVRVLLDEAVVSHASGVATLAAADLPEAVREAVPFDHAGAAVAREARAAAAAALRREDQLDALYPPATVRVLQVVPGGVIGKVLFWVNRGGGGIMNSEPEFIELDAGALGLVDGVLVRGLRLERLDEPYVYTAAFGALATIPRLRHYDKAGLAETSDRRTWERDTTPAAFRERRAALRADALMNRIMGR